MDKIFEYNLATIGYQTVPTQGFVSVLSVIVRDKRLVLYAIVDSKSTTRTDIDVVIVGTGCEYNLNSGWGFLGTCSMEYGKLIRHIWWNHTCNCS